MSKEKLQIIKEEVEKIRESNKIDANSLQFEANYEIFVNPENSNLFENAGSDHNVARAKQITKSILESKDKKDFLISQNKFMKKVMEVCPISEAQSNTSVNHIATFRKLLPEVLARSVNMSLAIENVAHIIDMPTNSMVVPFHRRVLGDSSSTTEALYNAIDSSFGGTGTHAKTFDPFVDSGDTDTTPADGIDDAFSFGNGNTRVASENLTFANMDKVANRIDQVTLTASSRNAAMSVSTEALQDARNEYDVDLIREGLITMQSEMYRALSAEVYARLATVARKETTVFDFATTGTDNADNFYLKNAFLFQFVETMRAKIQSETREPGLKFRIIATPRVISRLRMIDRLHVPLTDPKVINRDFDNVSFFRGIVGDYELYEAADYSGNNDFVMLVGKGTTASTSPIIYGNYVPFFMANTMSPDTTHELFFGKIRSGMVGNPLGNDNISSVIDQTQAGACKYARFMRVTGLV